MYAPCNKLQGAVCYSLKGLPPIRHLELKRIWLCRLAAAGLHGGGPARLHPHLPLLLAGLAVAGQQPLPSLYSSFLSAQLLLLCCCCCCCAADQSWTACSAHCRAMSCRVLCMESALVGLAD